MAGSLRRERQQNKRRRRLSVAPTSIPLTTTDLIVINKSMSVNLELTPKQKRPPGEPCCEPVVYPEVDHRGAERMASVARALGDPVRLQLVDVLMRHAGKVCVCELTPLFDIGQPTISHHLKILREAGVVGFERPGLWSYYYVIPEALEELSAWLKT
jgi:ArsR family transcriptional regulator, arsenate/arsenite/antimonite-responsive transcriptional repressor